MWDILALYHKWAIGLGLERFGLNVFTQTENLPFPSGRQLLCFSHPSTPVGRWTQPCNKMPRCESRWMGWGTCPTLLQVCLLTPPPVKEQGQQAAMPEACTSSLMGGHLAGSQGRTGGQGPPRQRQVERAVTPVGWGGISPVCPSIHLMSVLSLASRRPSLGYRCTQRLSCNYSYCQSKGWGFCLPQSETIRETQILFANGWWFVLFCRLLKEAWCYLTPKELQECHVVVSFHSSELWYLENRLTKSH